METGKTTGNTRRSSWAKGTLACLLGLQVEMVDNFSHSAPHMRLQVWGSGGGLH